MKTLFESGTKTREGHYNSPNNPSKFMDKALNERFVALCFACYVIALLALLCLPAVGAAQNSINIRAKVFLESSLIAPPTPPQQTNTCSVSNNLCAFPDGVPVYRAITKLTYAGGQCTGTFINNQTSDGELYLVTAFHCLPPGSSEDMIRGTDIDAQVETSLSPCASADDQLVGNDIKFIAGSEKADWALLWVDKSTLARADGQNLSANGPLLLGWNPNPLSTGSPIETLHHAQGTAQNYAQFRVTGWQHEQGQADGTTTFISCQNQSDCTHYDMESITGGVAAGAGGASFWSRDGYQIRAVFTHSGGTCNALASQFDKMYEDDRVSCALTEGGAYYPDNTSTCDDSIAVGTSFRDCPTCPEMIVVPSGKFTMGSPDDEEDRDSDEGPQHEVTIPAPFAVGKYEVTRGQFAEFAASTDTISNFWRDPGFTQTDNHPVVNVDWYEAKAYIAWLSEKTGQEYRLLSEAEWEYVARAGTTTRYSFGSTTPTSTQARYWHDGCGDDSLLYSCWGTVVVGNYPANAFGLHDVYGNVWEWVEDCWHGNYNGAPTDGSAWTSNCDESDRRVLRGGSWDSKPRSLRSAYPIGVEARNYSSSVGFRIARTLSP